MVNIASKLLFGCRETSKVLLRCMRNKDGASSRKKERETEETFTLDIIMEILRWLPVEDLLRLKCVCKTWYALIEDRHFIEKHMSRSAPEMFCNYYTIRVSRSALDMFFSRIGVRTRLTSNRKTFALICGCDGLTLERITSFRKCYTSIEYCIRNKATRRRLDLPDPHPRRLGMAFCFIPSAGEYKLVSVFKEWHRPDEIWEVLTIGKDKSWRPFVPDLQCCDKRSKRTMVVSAGCAVHCVRIIEAGSKFTAEVVSFNVETETFTSIVFPQEMFSDWRQVRAIDWNGFLSFAERLEENLYLTVVEDYKKLNWCEERIVVPLTSITNSEDLMEDLVPFVAKSGFLWFWLKYKRLIGLDLKSMKIRHIYAGIPEDRIFEEFYYGPRSLNGECECEVLQNTGCNGGLMDDALKFIIQKKGLTTEANYPCQAADGTCNSTKAASRVTKITGYEDVPANKKAALLKAVANQLVSVAINSGGSDVQFYSSGLFTEDSGTDLDYGVMAVGYGTSDDGASYWLVKNSWGRSWGENGYIRTQRDIDVKVFVELACKLMIVEIFVDTCPAVH